MKDQTNKKGNLYIQQENGLSMHSTAFVEMLTKRGLLEDNTIADKDVRRAKQAKKRNMYHNTLQLLRHYRDIRWMLTCLPAHVAEELEMPLQDLDALLNLVSNELEMDNRKLENRLKSIEKSRMMMDRLNEAISILREKPKHGEAMYNVLYYTFISPEHMSVDKVLDKLAISRRHYYRLRQQAINIISIRLWSAPESELDSWLEVLSLLEIL